MEEKPSVEEVDDYINNLSGQIMDGNAAQVSALRQSVMSLLKFQNRMNGIFDEIVEAISVGMLMLTDVNADMLLDEMQEWGIPIQKIEDMTEAEYFDDSLDDDDEED